MADHYTGNGLVVLASASFYANIIGFTPPNATRAEIDVTLLSDTYRRREPGDIVDWNGCRVRLRYDYGTQPPIEDSKEVFTVTAADGKVQKFVGFLTNYGPTEMVNDEQVEVECDIAIDGDVLFDDESGTVTV